MADANCETTYDLEDDCCAAELAGSIVEPEPPVEEPPPEEPPEEDSGCPYYCGFGSPEGVQNSTFEEATVLGAEYLQLDSPTTSHPWWAKIHEGETTGWRPWAGLGSEGTESYRIGNDSLASGENALAFGKSSLSAAVKGIAIGVGATVNSGAVEGIGIGVAVVAADATNGIGIGTTNVTNPNEVNIGNTNLSAAAVDSSAVVMIGRNISLNSARGTVAIGDGVAMTGTDIDTGQVLIGRNVSSAGAGNIVIGDGAKANPANSPTSGFLAGTYGVIVGVNSFGNGDCIVALGHDAVVRSSAAAALGTHTRAGTNQTTNSCAAIGRGAQALSTGGTAIGTDALVSQSHTNSTALGRAAETIQANELALGNWNSPYDIITLNTPTFSVLDRVGKDVSIAFGQGRGSGTAGTLRFLAAIEGASGTALQTMTPILELNNLGVRLIGGISAPIRQTSVDTSVALSDHTIVATAAAIINLANASGYWSSDVGRIFVIRNDTASDTVTIEPAGSEQINGAANLNVPNGESVMIQSTGTSWVTL